MIEKYVHKVYTNLKMHVMSLTSYTIHSSVIEKMRIVVL